MLKLNKIIGRKEEQKKLEALFKAKESGFAAIFGRRRIGKTFLVEQFFANKDCCLFHITGIRDGSMEDQLWGFTRVLESTFYDQSITIENPKTWLRAFELLTYSIDKYSQKKTVVLFFDELSWLVTKKSKFLQALEYYWNRYWSKCNKIKLIVCSSASSWIVSKIINAKGGLHNRVTLKIPLLPFTLFETKDFLQYIGTKYTDKQILDLYMVFGGIPFYLKTINKNLSVQQNINSICFNSKGLLFAEFKNLYASLFEEYEIYEEIIRTVASKRCGIARTELVKILKLSSSGGRLDKRLQELEQTGFIISFIPYGFHKKGVYYKIIDEYSLFYLNWIETFARNLNKKTNYTNYWIEISQTPRWLSWAGYAFESICYKHIDNIRDILHIPHAATIGSWQYLPPKNSKEDGAQIDLLFDRPDDVITICEIKYNKDLYKLDKQEAKSLLNKIEIFKKRTGTKKQITAILITVAGIQETIYSEELLHGTISAADLFSF
jgi:uncharacterized protein